MTKFVVKDGRIRKAMKMEQVMCHYLKTEKLENIKILDIGCGTGKIINYFNKNTNKIYAVDVYNQIDKNIVIKNFNQVSSAELPFEDNYFDIIISNHVVEHIQEQRLHMQEIYRCLNSKGICYYATPNKNFPIEPHHKIPLIHYLRSSGFHKILRLLGKYEEDLYLLSYKQMINSFNKNNFMYKEYTSLIMKQPIKFQLGTKLFTYFPMWLLNWLQWIIPTNIFVLSKTKSK
jgi:ubiquinone/menaquinone biosynthesis C-methylase UbiE